VARRPVAGSPRGAPAGFGLKVAGQSLYFKSYQPGIISVLRRRYGAFAGKAEGCVFALTSAPGSQSPFRPAVAALSDRLELGRGDFRAVVGPGRQATLTAAPSEQTLDAFLRSYISFRLLRSGGFMLHSAGLVKKGRAYLFLGKSGAGKSTLSKLAAANGFEVISDEINLVRPGKGGFRAYGSPFWGEMRADGRPGTWPLGGVYLLKKARRNTVQDCGPGEALRLLLRCAVNFDRSQEASALALENGAALLAGADFRRLGFSKADGSFLELIQ